MLGFAAVVVMALLVSCGPATPANVVLISIDTLRPDMLGSYGYPRPTSPTLDRLAAEGVLFENATAPAPWTLPSQLSLLTGRYPSRHGVKDYGRSLPVHVATLAEILWQQGYKTAGIVNARNMRARYGFARGFEMFRVHTTGREIGAEPSGVGDVASDWLGAEARDPFFLFLHFYDVHSGYRSLPRYERRFVEPYAGRYTGTTGQLTAIREGRVPPPGPEDVRHLEDLYVSSIRQIDDVVAGLLGRLEALDLTRNTLVIVTSDHGEEFLEHGSVLHGRTQYDEVLRVPLLVRGPGVPAGLRLSEPGSLIDVVPTILGLLGVSAPPGLDGEDLSRIWRDGSGAFLRDRFLFAEADWRNRIPDATRSVRYREFKLVYDRSNGEARLFHLTHDPAETTDVRAEHPELARLLQARLEEFMQGEVSGDPLPELDPEEIEHLKALGYL